MPEPEFGDGGVVVEVELQDIELYQPNKQNMESMARYLAIVHSCA